MHFPDFSGKENSKPSQIQMFADVSRLFQKKWKNMEFPRLFQSVTDTEKGLSSKEKIKLTFIMLFDDPLSKYLIFKIISCMQLAVLGYLPKLKRSSIIL